MMKKILLAALAVPLLTAIKRRASSSCNACVTVSARIQASIF